MKERPPAVWNSANTRMQEIGFNVTSVSDGGIVYVLTFYIRKLEMIHSSSLVVTVNLCSYVTDW